MAILSVKFQHLPMSVIVFQSSGKTEASYLGQEWTWKVFHRTEKDAVDDQTPIKTDKIQAGENFNSHKGLTQSHTRSSYKGGYCGEEDANKKLKVLETVHVMLALFKVNQMRSYAGQGCHTLKNDDRHV